MDLILDKPNTDYAQDFEIIRIQSFTCNCQSGEIHIVYESGNLDKDGKFIPIKEPDFVLCEPDRVAAIFGSTVKEEEKATIQDSLKTRAYELLKDRCGYAGTVASVKG